MKATLAFELLVMVLPILALAVPAQAPPAQAPAAPRKNLNDLAPFIDAAHIEKVKPLVRPNAIRQLARFGPLELPALKQMPEGMAHSHGEAPGGSGGGIMNAAGGTGMLDMMQFARGGLPLAIADFLSKTMDPTGYNVMHQTKTGICRNCTILSSKIDLVWPNGTRADASGGVYLHHIIGLNVGDRKMANNLFASAIPFCSGNDWTGKLAGAANGIMQAMRYLQAGVFAFGAVDEFRQWFTTPDGKFDSGYYRAPEDWLLFQAEIVNYKKEPQTVFLQFDIEHVPGEVGRPASTQFASATSCNESISFMGKGKGELQGKGHFIGEDGTLVAARGHMHDGGDGMEVLVNGKRVCDAKAIYGTAFAGEGVASKFTTISRVTDCNDAVHVKAKDEVTIVAKYDTEAHPLRESNGEAQMQMGLVAFTFVPDKK